MKDLLIGHYNTDHTGVTVVVAPKGAVGGGCTRGYAPGTREMGVLHPQNTVEAVHAAVLAGGSAFGLAAADGVMGYLREKGIGLAVGGHVVPIVPAAVLFDLKPDVFAPPTAEFGRLACEAAVENNALRGRVGAGRGATVGKAMGTPSQGGLGLATLRAGALEVSAVVAVNAVGDVYDMHTGKILAGALLPNAQFADQYNAAVGAALQGTAGQNTTVGIIYTNARLTKTEVNAVAENAHDGLAMSIRPVHTRMDGDTLFALATGEVDASIDLVRLLATEAVRLAIIDAVRA
ncbi:MAG: P1 family peptidase [Clostridiales bacterium]|jgi:L-aminopeptidase/D-esterase-like protein|nr:P1 family peptidase [Clostridiales bacterium]